MEESKAKVNTLVEDTELPYCYSKIIRNYTPQMQKIGGPILPVSKSDMVKLFGADWKKKNNLQFLDEDSNSESCTPNKSKKSKSGH